MKNQTQSHPSSSKFSVLRQLCNWIPPHLVSKLARQTGVEKKARTFRPWSHVVSLLFAQLTHAIGLNAVCDSLRLHSGALSAIRGATPPSRNNLSHANKARGAAMAEQLFWSVLERLQSLRPGFARGARFRLARRFKRVIHVVDSTTIQLVAACLDWAKHRRRKAAAKCHRRLDLHSFLPRFALIDTARIHDSRKARELCAGIHSGEIVLFDKAYLDFDPLFDLQTRGVFWVTRAKDDLQYWVRKKMPVAVGGLSGPERQRRALANLDGTVGVCALALRGLGSELDPQLYAAVCDRALWPVAEVGFDGFDAPLGDSRRRLPLPGPARASLFCVLALNLWDGTRAGATLCSRDDLKNS